MFHYFKYRFCIYLFFIFKSFRVKVSNHVRYRFMSNIVLIKCCASNVFPFLFIYIKRHFIFN